MEFPLLPESSLGCRTFEGDLSCGEHVVQCECTGAEWIGKWPVAYTMLIDPSMNQVSKLDKFVLQQVRINLDGEWCGMATNIITFSHSTNLNPALPSEIEPLKSHPIQEMGCELYWIPLLHAVVPSSHQLLKPRELNQSARLLNSSVKQPLELRGSLTPLNRSPGVTTQHCPKNCNQARIGKTIVAGVVQHQLTQVGSKLRPKLIIWDDVSQEVLPLPFPLVPLPRSA